MNDKDGDGLFKEMYGKPCRSNHISPFENPFVFISFGVLP